MHVSKVRWRWGESCPELHGCSLTTDCIMLYCRSVFAGFDWQLTNFVSLAKAHHSLHLSQTYSILSTFYFKRQSKIPMKSFPLSGASFSQKHNAESITGLLPPWITQCKRLIFQPLCCFITSLMKYCSSVKWGTLFSLAMPPMPPERQ